MLVRVFRSGMTLWDRLGGRTVLVHHHRSLAALALLPLFVAPALAAEAPAPAPGMAGSGGGAIVLAASPGPATLPPPSAERAGEAPEPNWFHNFEGVMGRSANFEFRTSLIETALLLAFFGGGVATAGTAFVAVVGTSSAVYLAHEYTWRAAMPGYVAEIAHPDDELATTKGLTYRAAHTLRAMALGAAFGGASLATTAIYTGTLVAAETVVYVLNDLAYGRLRRMMTRAAEPNGE
jgi:hypothetical protein